MTHVMPVWTQWYSRKRSESGCRERQEFVDASNCNYSALVGLIWAHCRGMFATHYHRLADDNASNPAVAIRHMACHVSQEADGGGEQVHPTVSLGSPWQAPDQLCQISWFAGASWLLF